MTKDHECHWKPAHTEADCPEEDFVTSGHPSQLGRNKCGHTDEQHLEVGCGAQPGRDTWETKFRAHFVEEDGGMLRRFSQPVDYMISVIQEYMDAERATLLQEIHDDVTKLTQDTRPVDVFTGERVETYGYEETHNNALKEVLRLLSEKETV